MRLDLKLIWLAPPALGLLVGDLDEDQLAQLPERLGRRELASGPQRLVALADRLDQRLLAHRGDVQGATLGVLELLRSAVLSRQVGDDVLLALQRTVGTAEVKEAPRHPGDDSDVLHAQLRPRPVARGLLHGLEELRVGDPVALALDDSEGVGSLIVVEHDHVCHIAGRAVGDRHLDPDPPRVVPVAVDQLGPELGPDSLLGVVVDLGASHLDVGDPRPAAGAVDLGVSICERAVEVGGH